MIALRFLHASIRDFLLNPSRSKEFVIDSTTKGMEARQLE